METSDIAWIVPLVEALRADARIVTKRSCCGQARSAHRPGTRRAPSLSKRRTFAAQGRTDVVALPYQPPGNLPSEDACNADQRDRRPSHACTCVAAYRPIPRSATMQMAAYHGGTNGAVP